MAKKKVVGFYLETALDREVELASTLLGLTKTDICEKALRAWLKRQDKELRKAKEELFSVPAED